MQARRLGRITTLITVQSTTHALVNLVVLVGVHLVGIGFVLWHLLVAIVSGLLCQHTRQVAHLKQARSGDLHFSIYASVLLIMSVEQAITSVGVAWVASVGYNWSHASEGAAAFCTVAGCVASTAAAGIALWASVKHVLSNLDTLVRCSRF